MTLSKRVQIVVDELYDGSWNKLAKDVGVNASTLQRVKEGGGMRSESLLHFCENLNLSPNWLLTGEGEKYDYMNMSIASIRQLAEAGDHDAMPYFQAWKDSGMSQIDDYQDTGNLRPNDIEELAEGNNPYARKYMKCINPYWGWWLDDDENYVDINELVEKHFAQESKQPGELLDPLSDDQIDSLRQQGTPPIDDFIQVPVYDIQASAGPGVLVESEEQKAVINFSPYYLSSLGVPSSKAAIIYVKGDSMLGTLDPETPILVDTGIQSMQQDGIYVIRIGDTLHVKRIQRQLDGSLNIISDNPRYQPYTISGADLEHVQIVGRVVLSVMLF